MNPKSSSGRVLAPLALVASVIAIAFVVSGSIGGSDNSSSGSDPDPAETSATTTQRGEDGQGDGGGSGGSGRLPDSTYVVKPGDNFESISSKTGIPTDRLLELNPELDPQALISGQRVKLR